MTTGEHMRRVRESANLTREQLSKRAGVRVLTIYNAETDKVSPTLYTVTHLADALNVSIDEYIGRRMRKLCHE